MNPTFKITPIGNLGNQMLQLMLARSLSRHVPGLVVSGYDMPIWNLRAPVVDGFPENALVLKGQHVEFNKIASVLKRGMLGEINFSALGFRMEHYLPVDEYRKLFVANEVESLGDDVLLINIRGAEILGDVHSDYGPIPLAFYRQLIESSGLRPVFMGQIADDAYSLALRRWFPGAEIIPSRGILNDFAMIRAAKHIVASVSTFSWLAAWLSSAATIHLPVCGIFNPLQRPDINLLPCDDRRYRFYELPVRRWVGSPDQMAALTHEGVVFPELTAVEAKQRVETAWQGIKWPVARYRAAFALRVFLRRHMGLGGGVIMVLD